MYGQIDQTAGDLTFLLEMGHRIGVCLDKVLLDLLDETAAVAK
ncbi:hypothetical protein [Paenibacillus luteus]|nr:hypothetical protein [Paenibacillus luteus]